MSADLPGHSEPLRVGLLWHSNRSYNLGVGALTAANIALAREAAGRAGIDVRFIIIGMRDNGPEYLREDDIEVFEVTSRSMLLNFPRLLTRVDCLLDIGAGDSFADIYGLKRFLFLWWSKALSEIRRRPILLAPQTIGPFSKRLYRTLAGVVMERAQLVVARDRISFDTIREIAPRAAALLSTDVAFALPFHRRARPLNGKVRVGVNVSGMLFNEAASGRNRFGLTYDYANMVRGLLARLTENPIYEVELICHVSAPDQPIDDDGIIADQLAGEFPTATRVPDFASPSEAKSHISGLDFLIAGRMHACIAAFSSGVPFAATAYSRKFAGLFGAFNYGGVVPQEGLSSELAWAEILRLLEARHELAHQIARRSPEIQGLLGAYVAELTRFFVAARGPGQ